MGTWSNVIKGELTPENHIASQSRTPVFPLGSRYVIDDRVFRYAHIKAMQDIFPRGRVAVSYNNAGTEKGTHLGVIINGAKTVHWTVQGIKVVKDQFKDGYLLMEGGFVKSIASNPYAAKDDAMQLFLKEPITEASAAAGHYGILVEGLYSNAVEQQLGISGLVIGVSLTDITEDYYAWLQTWGPCGVVGSAVAPGHAPVDDRFYDAEDQSGIVSPGISAADQMQIMSADGEQIIGYHIPYNTLNWENVNYQMLFLTISP